MNNTEPTRVRYFKRGELNSGQSVKSHHSRAGWWFLSYTDEDAKHFCGPYPTKAAALNAMRAHDRILTPFQTTSQDHGTK